MATRMRVRVGNVEVEFEGDVQWNESGVMQAVDSLLERVSKFADSNNSTSVELSAIHDRSVSQVTAMSRGVGTVSTVAAKIGARTGSDLVKAAAASLTLSKGQGTFQRAELISEMRSASAYFKQTYVNNLSSMLNRMIKEGTLLEVAKGTFSLSAAALDDLEGRLN